MIKSSGSDYTAKIVSTRFGWLKQNAIFLILSIVVIHFVVFVWIEVSRYNLPLGIQLASEVAQQVQVPVWEIPQISLLQDVEALKNANPVQKEVYGQAQNGDYALAYQSKLVIYRRSEGKIIRQGPTLNDLLASSSRFVISQIVQAAAKTGIVLTSTSPQVTIVQDPSQFKALNSSFYSQLIKDDIVAIFDNEKKVIIYRPSSDQIIKSGNYLSTISAE